MAKNEKFKKSKIAKYKERRRPKPNPNEDVGVLYNLGAGFGGYAVVRLFARMIYSQAIKRVPKLASHVHFAAGVLGATGVYFGSKYWKRMSEYHEGALIGAGIALLQTGVQTYVPKLGWIVSDISPEQYTDQPIMKALPSGQKNQTAPSFDIEALLAGDPDLESVPFDGAPDKSEEDEMPGDIEEPLLGTDSEDDLFAYGGMLQ
jgi:hypothetical protein